MSLDVLEEADSGAKKSNAVCNVGPQVPLVVCAETLASCAEGLAWVAAREHVHQSRKLLPREGLEIAPDRSRIKLPAFHSRKKDFDCEGFDLRISDCAQVWEHSFKSEVNASVPGAKREMSDFGSIHMKESPVSPGCHTTLICAYRYGGPRSAGVALRA